MLRTVLLGCSLALLCPATALAGELTYDAPEGCPAQGVVTDRLAARAPNSRDATVKVRRVGRGFTGHLTIGDGEETVERDVTSERCDSVIDALVLVLALDRPSTAEPASASSRSPALASPSASTAAPVLTAEAPPTADRGPREGGEVEPPRSALELAVVQNFVHRSLASQSVTGAAVFGEIAAPGLLGWTPYRPSARVGVVGLTTLGSLFGSSAPHSFAGGSAQLCPLGFAALSTHRAELTFSACGVLDGGHLTNTTPGAWWDAGGVLRAALQVGPKAKTRAFLEVSVGALGRIGAEAVPVPLAAVTSRSRVGSLDLGDPPSLRLTSTSGAMGMLALGGGAVFP